MNGNKKQKHSDSLSLIIRDLGVITIQDRITATKIHSGNSFDIDNKELSTLIIICFPPPPLKMKSSDIKIIIIVP